MFDNIRFDFAEHLSVSVYNHKEDMLGSVVVFLIPCALASVCRKRDSCHYPDTKLLGVPFLDIPTADIIPLSCLSACMLIDSCFGAALDPLVERCYLYGKNASFGIIQDPSVNMWLFQATEVPCVTVSKMTIYT